MKKSYKLEKVIYLLKKHKIKCTIFDYENFTIIKTKDETLIFKKYCYPFIDKLELIKKSAIIGDVIYYDDEIEKTGKLVGIYKIL